MNTDFLYLINQIKRTIDTHDRIVSGQVDDLMAIIAGLEYSKRKINTIIENFDEKTLDEKNEVLLDINDEYGIKYDEMDAYTLIKSCWSRASQEQKNSGVNLLNRFIADLDKRIAITKDKIDVINNESKYKKLLSYFDEETGEMIKPIENREDYYLLSEFFSKNEALSNKSSILSDIALENLRLLKARDEKLLELKKKEALLKRRKQAEKQKVKQAVVSAEKEDLTEDQKNILETVKVILSENSEFFDNVPSEAAAGFEMIKEENAHYYELADNKTNLCIALLDLNDMVHQISDNKDYQLFDVLKDSIIKYREILLKISSEQKTRDEITSYINKEEIDLDRIRNLAKRFATMDENLSDGERNLLITIGSYISSDISEEDKIKTINQTSTGSRINLSFYKEYKLLEEIYDIYSDYELYTSEDNSIDSIDGVKKILDKMKSLLSDYDEYLTKETIIEYEKANGSASSIETPNDMLFLTVDDAKFGTITGIESYIRDDKKSPYRHRIRNIKENIKILSICDMDNIQHRSQPCLGAKILGADESKIRKTRASDYRVCFANINAFKTFSWPSDKPCYLVLFAGFKMSQKDVYRYASSGSLEKDVIRFLRDIQNKIDNINSQRISEEAKKEQLEKFRIELLEQNHELYNKSMESLAADYEPEMLTEEGLKEEGGLKNE